MLAITGITGHTGRFFMSELKKNKYDGKIRCLVRSMEKGKSLLNNGLDCEVLEGNLDNEGDIRRFLFGADEVLHIANIHYSTEIIRIGVECGVKRFVLVHTTGIFSKYKSASDGYRKIEEQIIPLMYKYNITILRPTMIFGDICDYNISKFIAMIDCFPIVPIISGGESLIQPVNARDLAQAYFKVLNEEKSIGKAYNLSGEAALSIRELYQMISRCLGKKRVIISFPMKVCVFGARVIRNISRGKIDLVEKIQRMGEDRSFSHEDAKMDFGYTPEPFGVGLQREVDEYVDQKR